MKDREIVFVIGDPEEARICIKTLKESSQDIEKPWW